MKDPSERPYSEFAEYCAVCGEHDHEENAHLNKTPRKPKIKFVGQVRAAERIEQLSAFTAGFGPNPPEPLHTPEEQKWLDDFFAGTKRANREKAELQYNRLLTMALELVVELWPKPSNATIHLESHQWAKLREVLLAIPELRARDDTNPGS